ncbi:hypothetical protein V7149_00350 [Bacillus sp. JJ1503]|uniref:hypothetical protein n=1 Tax=Bacillus sp. JJ1503 TaxID=3122956 RepID=UPI002FFEC91F
MANLNNITVNVSLNGPLDVDKIAEELKATIHAEMMRVGISVEVSKQYRLVTDREPKVGDFVKFTKTDDDDLTIGKYYEVEDVDCDGDLVITGDNGDTSFAMYTEEEFKVYEKVSADTSITHNGTEYSQVDRKAQPGDVVVFTATNSDYFTNGKIYGPVSKHMTVVDDVGNGCLSVYNNVNKRTVDNVKVYAPVTDGQPKGQTFKVGDYAKVVNASTIYNENSIPEGEIVEIVEDDKSETPYRMKSLISGELRWAKAKHIVRATDEEVAEAKAQQAELAKWAAIGRKPNEFKKGDIAKLVLSNGSTYFGEIADVRTESSVGFKHLHAIKYGTTREYIKNLTLITPVEARFDWQ